MGAARRFIGEWLATKGADVRDRIVIATKTFNPMDEGHDHGLGRARIRRQIDTSLRRLGVERVALYLAHEFDPDIPQEETLQAFDELVAGREGRRRRRIELQRRATRRGARALGAGRAASLRVGAERLLAARAGRPRDRVPGLPRARPRLHPVQPARRRLADRQVPPRRGAARRVADDAAARAVRGYSSDRVFDALESSSARPPSAASRWPALALAWLLAQPEVTAIVVGPGRADHLAPAFEALEITLSPAERDSLTEVFA